MTATSKEQLDELIQVVANLHIATVRDEDARVASEAAANLCSGTGFLNAPMEVLQMFAQAIEVGYAAALHDVRDGAFDERVRDWRPDLFEA
ncbi:hypothetical protein ACFQ6V_08905 [Streptomyces roseifaciens]